jgi:hypothetical protein
MTLLRLLTIMTIAWSCTPTNHTETDSATTQQVEQATAVPPHDTVVTTTPVAFERDAIKERLAAKIAIGEPLVIHSLIPLCDNENQGIVKVNQSLGDGLNLSTNLYWGAKYGFKSHFRRDSNWTLLTSYGQPSEHILERVVFERNYPDGTKVLLIGDAYRGDRMRACLFDYFHSLAGSLTDTLVLTNSRRVATNAAADLLIFNGHNGLMDSYIEPFDNVDGKEKDAVAIACISSSYFNEYFIHLKAYPLLMTTSLLAPEAYVLSNVIDAWVGQESEEEILLSAARGYNEYQKCGMRGAKSLFKTGW